MTNILHKISPKHTRIIAAVLSLVLVLGAVSFIAPVEAQALAIDASDSGYYNVAYGTKGETTFGDGTRIRVINQTRANKSKSEAVYTLGTDGWDADNTLVWDGTGENTIYGIYPYNASYDEFTIPAEQSGGVQDADWMTATYTGAKPSNKSVDLHFNHLLTKVTIKVNTWGSEYGDTTKAITEAKIYSLATDIKKDDSGAATANTASLTAITPLYDETEKTYTAIICPGTYTKEQQIMSLKVNDTDSLTVLANANESLTTEGGLKPGYHYTFELTVGKNAVELTTVTVSDWKDGGKIDGGVAKEVPPPPYTYDEATNTYTVRTADALNTAISNAKTSGTAEKPAKIMLMNDIAVEAKEGEYGIEYAVLIETGNIIIDLNGCQLSATNDPRSIIQIGAVGGELCDAVVTIDDSSIDKSGKIVGLYTAIDNYGGTLICNNGTIEVNCTEATVNATGINSYLGSVTVNGGKINVTGVSTYRAAFGIFEDGTGGTVTINGGSINVTGPVSTAFYARSSWSIKGGTIATNGNHIEVSGGTVSLQTNDEGIGATFVGGIKSTTTLNTFLSEGVGYYDADGNLIDVADDVKEITDKGDITIRKNN